MDSEYLVGIIYSPPGWYRVNFNLAARNWVAMPPPPSPAHLRYITYLGVPELLVVPVGSEYLVILSKHFLLDESILLTHWHSIDHQRHRPRRSDRQVHLPRVRGAGYPLRAGGPNQTPGQSGTFKVTFMYLSAELT